MNTASMDEGWSLDTTTGILRSNSGVTELQQDCATFLDALLSATRLAKTIGPRAPPEPADAAAYGPDIAHRLNIALARAGTSARVRGTRRRGYVLSSAQPSPIHAESWQLRPAKLRQNTIRIEWQIDSDDVHYVDWVRDVTRRISSRLSRSRLGTLWRVLDSPPALLGDTGASIELSIAPTENGSIGIEVRGLRRVGFFFSDYLYGTTESSRLRGDLIALVESTCEVLIDDESMAQFVESGARHPRAYRLYRDALDSISTEALRNQERNARTLRKAIELDPGFPAAYELIDSAYYRVAFATPSPRRRRELREAVRALWLQARRNSLPMSITRTLETRLRALSLASPEDAERYWREASIADPHEIEPLRTYSFLLFGAGWDVAAENVIRYNLARAPADMRDAISTDMSGVAGVRGDPKAKIREMNWVLEVAPDHTTSNFGMVEAYAHLGKFKDAETYLHRMQAEDTEGLWTNAARMSFLALRGDIPLGSEALREAFAHPLTTNVMRGRVCFILGDVAGGVGYWQDIEPEYRHLLWYFLGDSEYYFADGVVSDPRYMSMLESIGLGRTWIEQLRLGYNEIACHFGLPPIAKGEHVTRREARRFASIDGPKQRAVLQPAKESLLTPAERKLLAALQRGLTLTEYAEASGRSIHTVRNQVKQLLQKTGSRRQADLLRRFPGNSS